MDEIVQNTGLAGLRLLGLSVEDWFNLGLSLVIVLTAYLIGSWTIHWLLPRLVRRTKTDLDERLLQVSGNELRWLVVVLVLSFATKRLDFINANLKTFLGDIYFLVILLVAIFVMFRLSNLIAQTVQNRAKLMGQQEEAESLITLVVWGFRSIVIVIAISLLLNHFGINITGFAVLLGIIGLVISFAGREVLADIIAGAMILIDKPFRIGDRLDLPSLNSWGDVVDIGMRSTKILSMENRMVVLPNSLISSNQVVNYSYPDPSYFNLVNVLVAYDNDPDYVSKIIETAIRTVEGVQTEREVIAWLMELTEYHMVFWAAWWVANYTDRYPVQNQVSREIIRALKEAEVVLPYRKGLVDLGTNANLDVLPGKRDGDHG